NGLRAFGLRPLLHSPHLGPVHSLRLDGNRLGEMGGQVLARWPGLKGVRTLSLGNCGLGEVAARELLDGLGPLSLLDLHGNDIPDEVADRFRAAQEAGRIAELVLD
ncbi:MAG: hypothetical protein K2W96_16775, partial [Gemmataceae bacterium]|nr:hypothetical protein [Gemmataceae bacterium]